MLTQRQLVNTIQVQLLTTERPLPTISQDSNSLLPSLPSLQDLPPEEHTIKWSWDWQVSLWWFAFAVPWGIGLERDLQISPGLYLAPPKTTKVVNPGSHWSKAPLY